MNSPDTSPDQKRAIEALSENVSVSAGAGTGKTHVLVERFVEIVRKNLAKTAEILAITFTEKAANEMKARIVARLKSAGLNDARREIENAYIGTIHAFCSRLLKEHPVEAGMDPDFQVIEEDEANLLKEIVLDHVIESRFQESGAFELLYRYSEEKIREDIKEVHKKIFGCGASLEKTISNSGHFQDFDLRNELIRALNQVGNFKNKSEKAEETIQFLESHFDLDWSYVEMLKSFNKKFDLRSKEGKEEVLILRAAFEKFIQFQVERIGLPFHETFCSLLRDFSERYEFEKKERASFDFNDLQRLASNLLSGGQASSVAIRSRYQKQFKFIMVDEFQDTDPLQAHLIELIQNHNNLFIVGDVKQAIYGFRGTDPEIFRGKEKEFETKKTGIRVSLTGNFRSRPEIIDFVNHFFDGLWRKINLKTDFLTASRTFPKPDEFPIELLEIEREEKKSIDELRRKEAKTIAARIQELVASGNFEYKDFAILFRAATKMNIYEQELRNLQIPYHLIGGHGFYHQPEIRDLMNFLTIIENPLHDIPLAGVLRSPMFQVTDDTLFWLSRRAKSNDKRSPFLNGVNEFENIAEILETERGKLIRFKKLYGELLSERDMSVSQTLEFILKETQYDLYVLGLPQGKRHFANLRKLVDLARELETRDVIHLGDFVRYVKGIQFHEVRESEAQIEAEEGRVVKLLTIHKSKGLEFCAVILPDLLYEVDSRDWKFRFDSDLGIGIQVYNPETADFEKSLTYQSILERNQMREEAEAKRLLYVAMTRAKEHLILSGVAGSKKEPPDDSENWLERAKSTARERNLPIRFLNSETSDQKRGRRRLALIEKKSIRKKIENGEPIQIKEIPEEASKILEQLKPQEAAYFERIDLPVSAYVAFEQDPAHEEYKRTYELGAMPRQEFKSEELPAVDGVELISAADFGTVIHKIFEHLIVKPNEAKVRAEKLIHFYAGDFDSETQSKVSQLVQIFLKSQVYSEIRNAKRIFAELPFVLRLRHGIIQGSIDLLYETRSGDFVIVDYKTSEIDQTKIKETGEKYRSQMELYGLACHEILGHAPAKAVLYFVKPDAAYDILLGKVNLNNIKNKYESLQKEIIEFRRRLVYESTR